MKAIYDLGCRLIDGLTEGKLGILYCSGEKNSQSTVGKMVSYLKLHNRDYVIKTISNSSEAKQATAALSHQAQAIFVPMDSVVQSAMNDVCETAAQTKVAVLGSDPVMVRFGALLSVACSNQKIGAYSADMAVKILEGASPTSLPVHMVDDNEVLVSPSAARRLGLDVSGFKDITLVDDQLNPVRSPATSASGKPSSQATVAVSGDSGLGGMLLDVVQSSLLMGLEYGLLAIGVYITFRVLNLADLTVDGSFGLGICVSALLTVSGHPVLGLVLGFLAGAVAGSITGTLIVKAKTNLLLAGIITMTGLYGVNTFILGGPNLSLLNAATIVSGLQAAILLPEPAVKLLIVGVIDSLTILALIAYFKTESGLSMRDVGNNELTCRSSSINTGRVKALGLSLANALVGLCGALLVQYQGFADISSVRAWSWWVLPP